MNLFDLKKIDEQLFQLFSEFQVMANRKKEIDEMVLEPEIRTRLLSSIKSSVSISLVWCRCTDLVVHAYRKELVFKTTVSSSTTRMTTRSS